MNLRFFGEGCNPVDEAFDCEKGSHFVGAPYEYFSYPNIMDTKFECYYIFLFEVFIVRHYVITRGFPIGKIVVSKIMSNYSIFC